MKQTYLFSISVITVIFGCIVFAFGILAPHSDVVENVLLASTFSLPIGLSYIIISYMNSWFNRRRTVDRSAALPLKKSQLILLRIGSVIIFVVLQAISYFIFFLVVCSKTACF